MFRYFLRQKPQTLHKTQSTPNLANGGFSALPFPSHIFSGYAYEMMKVNKEYREMQKTTRYVLQTISPIKNLAGEMHYYTVEAKQLLIFLDKKSCWPSPHFLQE